MHDEPSDAELSDSILAEELPPSESDEEPMESLDTEPSTSVAPTSISPVTAPSYTPAAVTASLSSATPPASLPGTSTQDPAVSYSVAGPETARPGVPVKKTYLLQERRSSSIPPPPALSTSMSDLREKIPSRVRKSKSSQTNYIQFKYASKQNIVKAVDYARNHSHCHCCNYHNKQHTRFLNHLLSHFIIWFCQCGANSSNREVMGYHSKNCKINSELKIFYVEKEFFNKFKSDFNLNNIKFPKIKPNQNKSKSKNTSKQSKPTSIVAPPSAESTLTLARAGNSTPATKDLASVVSESRQSLRRSSETNVCRIPHRPPARFASTSRAPLTSAPVTIEHSLNIIKQCQNARSEARARQLAIHDRVIALQLELGALEAERLKIINDDAILATREEVHMNLLTSNKNI